MRSRILTMFLIFMALATIHGYADDTHHKREPNKQEKKGPELVPQTTCPVMGGKINRKMFVDHAGKRIYVCCRACIKSVKQNPEKHIAKLQELNEVPEDTPKSDKESGKK